MTHSVKQTISRAITAAFLLGAIALTGCATSGTSSSNTSLGEPLVETQTQVSVSQKAHVTRTGEAYLMRGLANVFSRGMDTMAEKLRNKGVDAVSFNHSNWKGYAQDIIQRSKSDEVSFPVMIMGHSLGGNESSKFANYLASNGVEVALVVAFDPVETGRVGPHIDKVINYYLPNDKDNRILAGNGFDGKLQNIDVTTDPDIRHVNVEKNDAFQAASIKSVMEITKAL